MYLNRGAQETVFIPRQVCRNSFKTGAIAIAWVWLEEVPASPAVLGGLLVLLGVGLVNLLGRPKQARGKASPTPGSYPAPLPAGEGDGPGRDRFS